jgi:hypothetical protein
VKLKKLPRPAGQADHYQFFENQTSGRKFKVKVEMRDGQDPTTHVGGPMAPVAFAVAVSASPIDEEGKALRDRGGRPIVTEYWTHLFTPHEMSLPDFDPEKKVMELVESRIKQGEHRMDGERKLLDFVSKWKG